MKKKIKKIKQIYSDSRMFALVGKRLDIHSLLLRVENFLISRTMMQNHFSGDTS
jgi:hypothetical protein